MGFTGALLVFVFWGSRLYPDTLALLPDRTFRSFELWRISSTLVFFGTLHEVFIAPFVLGMTGLWLLGSPLERWLTTRRFLILYFSCALIGHLAAGLVGLASGAKYATGGPSPGVWGITVAVGLIYWEEQVFVLRPLPLLGKHLLLGLLGIFAVATISDLATGFPILHKVATGVGGGVGALFVTRFWRLSRLLGGSPGRTRFVVLPGGLGSEPSQGRAPGGKNGSGRGSAPPTPPKKFWN